MKKKLLLLVCLSLCLLSCALENIPMEWRPTADLYREADTRNLSPLLAEKIKLVPFVDLRENPKEIGRNVERPTRPKPVTTRDDVGQWCTEKFRYCLGQFGITPVTSGASLILKGEIVQFYVREDNLYNGNVGLRLKAERPNGKVVWQGMMVGSISRMGRSLKDENYYEILSDSFVQAFHAFLKDDSLAKALQAH